MAALPALITVEQFRQMKDDGRAYELRHGEVVCVTRPRLGHHELRDRLVERLKSKLGTFGHVTMELAFRPVPEFELRAADVAVVSQSRWDESDRDDNLDGAPDLVIEVKSPSNTKRELREKASICLLNGALEFWIVEAGRKSVTVVHRDGTTTLYTSGETVPLALFSIDSISIDEIFS